MKESIKESLSFASSSYITSNNHHIQNNPPLLNTEFINNIKEYLAQGKILALPTETVMGLICHAENQQAIENLYQLKRRCHSKTFAIFCPVEQINRYVKIQHHWQQKLIDHYLPGPVSLILPAQEALLQSPSRPYIINPAGEISLRIPKMLFWQELLAQLDHALVATSANLSGLNNTNNYSEFRQQFIIPAVRSNQIGSTTGDIHEQSKHIIHQRSIHSSSLSSPKHIIAPSIMDELIIPETEYLSIYGQIHTLGQASSIFNLNCTSAEQITCQRLGNISLEEIQQFLTQHSIKTYNTKY